MSRAELARCDSCGTTEPVPASALRTSPDGWFRVFGPTGSGDYCSAHCVGEAFRPHVVETPAIGSPP